MEEELHSDYFGVDQCGSIPYATRNTPFLGVEMPASAKLLLFNQTCYNDLANISIGS